MVALSEPDTQRRARLASVPARVLRGWDAPGRTAAVGRTAAAARSAAAAAAAARSAAAAAARTPAARARAPARRSGTPRTPARRTPRARERDARSAPPRGQPTHARAHATHRHRGRLHHHRPAEGHLRRELDVARAPDEVLVLRSKSGACVACVRARLAPSHRAPGRTAAAHARRTAWPLRPPPRSRARGVRGAGAATRRRVVPADRVHCRLGARASMRIVKSSTDCWLRPPFGAPREAIASEARHTDGQRRWPSRGRGSPANAGPPLRCRTTRSASARTAPRRQLLRRRLRPRRRAQMTLTRLPRLPPTPPRLLLRRPRSGPTARSARWWSCWATWAPGIRACSATRAPRPSRTSWSAPSTPPAASATRTWATSQRRESSALRSHGAVR